MFKAILIPVLVLACACSARAGDASPSVADSVSGSAQDFETFAINQKNVHLQADTNGLFWSSPLDENLVQTAVTNDTAGFKYLYVNASESPDEGLMRTFACQGSAHGDITNAYTRVSGDGGYPGFYCQFKTKFPLFDRGCEPAVDEVDRLVIWARKHPTSDVAPGELYVSAGRFDGDLRTIVRQDYLVAGVGVDETAWHEVTIRTIPDIVTGSRALGFEIWIDGSRVSVGGDYPVVDGLADLKALTDEARALINGRRLFPSMSLPGSNRSVALGGVSFTGIGVVDDLSVATNAPGTWALAPRVFTLNWDAGVTALKYQIGTSAEVTVPSAAIAQRSVIFEIPASETPIKVTAEYATSRDFSQGFWDASGACSLITNIVGSVTNYSFRCDASAKAGAGYVRSFRREIGLGGGVGAFATFADAKDQAKKQGVNVIVLNEDFAPLDLSSDDGHIEIAAGETITIDLNGHKIGNVSSRFATIINYGTLTIVDSVGGGRILPSMPYDGSREDYRQESVHNYASKKSIPTLYIEGGIFDGAINNSGVVTNTVTQARLEPVMVIRRNRHSPSEPKFISVDSEVFEWNDKLEDKTLYYAYKAPYWKPETNACVWCGKGGDGKWSTAANWRAGSVPGADELVIFPASTNAWEVDLGNGVVTKNFRFLGDVILHGSNDCNGVRWEPTSAGRVGGDATLVWKGVLPGDLSTLLDESWSGQVVIAEVGASLLKMLHDIVSWGTASSKVVFQGVRGCCSQLGALMLPYELELRNGVNGYAWKNDAGYNGGVVEFAKLSGDGTFVSITNLVPNRQLIVFRDIDGFTGRIDAFGKRVLLGTGEAATLEAGSITWSDGLKLKRVVTHRCQVAAFGGTMEVSGAIGDVLAEYYESTVGDESEVVTLRPSGTVAELCVTNPMNKVVIAPWSEEAVLVDGRRVVANALDSVNSLSSIKTSAAQVKKLRFASYYTPSVTMNGQLATVKLQLNENAVPVLGGEGGESASIVFRDGMASVVVSGVIEGFWYGLEYKSSLTEDWPSEPYVWSVADSLSGGKAELVAPAEGASGFYRVVVSDVMPGSAGGGK